MRRRNFLTGGALGIAGLATTGADSFQAQLRAPETVALLARAKSPTKAWGESAGHSKKGRNDDRPGTAPNIRSIPGLPDPVRSPIAPASPLETLSVSPRSYSREPLEQATK